MRNIAAAGIALLSSFGLVACSTTTTTIYPGRHGVYQAVSLSRNQGDGVTASMQKARKICAAQGRSLVVLNHRSHYQGTDKEAGEISEVASDAVLGTTGVYVPSLKQNNDYKTVIRFRCK